MIYLGMVVLFVSGVFFGSGISNDLVSLGWKRFNAVFWSLIACLGVALVMGGRF